MYMNPQTLRQAFRTLYTEPFSLRRVEYTAGLVGVMSSLIGSTALGRALDEVLYPEYRDTSIDAPLYVVACARSGTSLLHELLALDEARFTHFKLYQTLLPSVTAYKAVKTLANVDADHGDHLRGLIETLDHKLFNKFQDVHPMGLADAEEDEQLFVYTLLTPTVYLFFPWVRALPHLVRVDAMPKEVRDRLVEWYRGCIKRHVFATGGRRTMLIKNVHLASRFQVTLEAFPDARFVHLVRHPYEAVASAASTFHMAWGPHSPELGKDSPEARDFAETYIELYRYLHEQCSKLPDNQVITIPYLDLVRDPAGTVKRIYDRFGYEMSDAYRDTLLSAVRERKKHRSKHKYTLEQFGLTKDQVYSELKECFEAYGFER